MLDRRIIAAGILLLALLGTLVFSSLRSSRRQERHFAILLEEVRSNSEQISGIDRVLGRIGQDSSEVRQALMLDPVHYSIQPQSRQTDSSPDRFEAFIRAFEHLERHVTNETDTRFFNDFLADSSFSRYLTTRGLTLSREGLSLQIEDGDTVVFSGQYVSGKLLVSSRFGTGSYKGPADTGQLVDFLSKELLVYRDLKTGYLSFSDTVENWLSGSAITRELRSRYLVFERIDDRDFKPVFLLRSHDNRSIARLSPGTAAGSVVFGEYEYVSLSDFFESFFELIKSIDTRSNVEIQIAQTMEFFETIRKDPEFASVLTAYGFSLSETVRDSVDFYLFDLYREDRHYGSFAILKESGELFLLDSNGVHLTSLRRLSDHDLMDGAASTQKKNDSGLSAREDLFSILICGTHESNPDAMILFVGSKTSGEAALFSLPRDLYYRGLKINGIYRKFGPDQFMRDISRISGISIEHYIAIDMYAFIDIINILGGVEITLEEPLIDPSYRIREEGQWKTLNYPRGTHKLDGMGALRIVRSRHTSSDFERAERQQMVISAVAQKIGSLADADIRTIYQLVNSTLRHVTTNLSPVEAVSTLLAFRNVNLDRRYVLNTSNVLYQDWSPSGLWILLPKEDDWTAIASFIQNKIEFL